MTVANRPIGMIVACVILISAGRAFAQDGLLFGVSDRAAGTIN